MLCSGPPHGPGTNDPDGMRCHAMQVSLFRALTGVQGSAIGLSLCTTAQTIAVSTAEGPEAVHVYPMQIEQASAMHDRLGTLLDASITSSLADMLKRSGDDES